VLVLLEIFVTGLIVSKVSFGKVLAEHSSDRIEMREMGYIGKE